MIQLISNPEKYDGHRVVVVGFLRLEFEGDELYLHREDYENSIHKNGLWIELDPKLKDQVAQLNMHYVVVGGLFSAANQGHMAAASGSILIDSALLYPRKSRSDVKKH